MGKREGSSRGVCRGANIGARGGARRQIIGASLLLRAPKTFDSFEKKCIKCVKKDYRILLSLEEVCYDKMKKNVRRYSQEEQFEIATF